MSISVSNSDAALYFQRNKAQTALQENKNQKTKPCKPQKQVSKRKKIKYAIAFASLLALGGLCLYYGMKGVPKKYTGFDAVTDGIFFIDVLA